jgi:hypothetical protein
VIAYLLKANRTRCNHAAGAVFVSPLFENQVAFETAPLLCYNAARWRRDDIFRVELHESARGGDDLGRVVCRDCAR